MHMVINNTIGQYAYYIDLLVTYKQSPYFLAVTFSNSKLTIQTFLTA